MSALCSACISGSDTCIIILWSKLNAAECVLTEGSSWHELRACMDEAASIQAYNRSSNHKQQFCLVSAADNK